MIKDVECSLHYVYLECAKQHFIMRDSPTVVTTNVAVLKKDLGFIRSTFFDSDTAFDLQEAKKQYQGILSITEGKPFKVLVDTRNSWIVPEKEAQSYISNLEGKIAEAIIVKTLAVRILSNFYIKLNEKVPSKVFTDEDKAIKWLKEQ